MVYPWEIIPCKGPGEKRFIGGRKSNKDLKMTEAGKWTCRQAHRQEQSHEGKERGQRGKENSRGDTENRQGAG